MLIDNPLLIVTALGWEAASVRRGMQAVTIEQHGDFRLWRARPDGPWLLQTGMGMRLTTRALEWATAYVSPATILSTGCAGALSPGLRPGELVIAEEIVTPDGVARVAAPAWIAAYCEAARTAGVRAETGRILTSPRMLGTPKVKRQAAENSGALAVEMEGAAIADFASARRLGFAAARVIIDTLATSLPEGMVDATGKATPGRILAALLRRPALLSDLLAVGAATRRCRISLAAVHHALAGSFGAGR